MGVFSLCVCLFVLFVRLQISQWRKKIRACNFACVFNYYPDILVNFGSCGVTAAALYVMRDVCINALELRGGARRGAVSSRNLGRWGEQRTVGRECFC